MKITERKVIHSCMGDNNPYENYNLHFTIYNEENDMFDDKTIQRFFPLQVHKRVYTNNNNEKEKYVCIKGSKTTRYYGHSTNDKQKKYMFELVSNFLTEQDRKNPLYYQFNDTQYPIM